MKIQTFVFVHDEKIIIDFIANKKFEDIKNLKYVFLGNKSCENVRQLPNIIVARDYEDNMEKWNLLTAYSGWYLLWKNKLIDQDTDLINMFEYDIILAKNFNEIQSTYITKETEVASYVWITAGDRRLLKLFDICPPFLLSAKKHYGIDFMSYVDKLDQSMLVGVTSNQTMKPSVLHDFMEWAMPIIEDLKEERMVGHMVERLFPLFHIYNNLKSTVIQNTLTHFQMDTHNTQNMPDRFVSNYESLIKN